MGLVMVIVILFYSRKIVYIPPHNLDINECEQPGICDQKCVNMVWTLFFEFLKSNFQYTLIFNYQLNENSRLGLIDVVVITGSCSPSGKILVKMKVFITLLTLASRFYVWLFMLLSHSICRSIQMPRNWTRPTFAPCKQSYYSSIWHRH